MEAGSSQSPASESPPKKPRSRVLVIAAAALVVLVVVVLLALRSLGTGGDGLLAASAGPTLTFDGESPGKTFFALTDGGITARVPAKEGAKYSFSWGDGSGPSVGTNAHAGHHFKQRGTYTVSVSVDGGPASTREIRVYDAPKPAIDVTRGGKEATLNGYGENVVFVGDTVTFTAARTSVDPDRSVASYKWDFDRGSGLAVDAEGVEAATSFPDAGGWSVRLTVTDDLGTQRTTDVFLVVGSVTTTTGKVGTGIPPGTSKTFTDILLDVDQSPRRGRAAVHVDLIVTWTPGAVPQTSDLNLTLLDAAQKIVSAAAKEGEAVTIILGYDVGKSDTRGVWTARLARDFPTDALTTGVATEDVPFTLEARVTYG